MANDFRIIIKYGVKTFKTEHVGKENITWTYEKNVEKAYEDYKNDGETDDKKSKLVRLIYKAYGGILTDINNEKIIEDYSTLAEVVCETLNGKYEYNFESMLKNYDENHEKSSKLKDNSFLMYFHRCVSKKYLTARVKEARADEIGSESFNQSGYAKLKKIDKESFEIFARKAEHCSDAMLEVVCDSLIEKGIFKNINVQKARKIISENTVVDTRTMSYQGPNDEVDAALNKAEKSGGEEEELEMDEDKEVEKLIEEGRAENFNDFFDEESAESSPDAMLIDNNIENQSSEMLEKIGKIINEIKVTEINRYNFNMKVMYDYMYKECHKKLNDIRPVYCLFVKTAIWLNGNERQKTKEICNYMHDFAKKNKKFPNIGNVAKDVLQMKDSTRLNQCYNAVREKILEKLSEKH